MEPALDLTSGTPFWPVSDGLLATYPRLRNDRRCDVVIIGGGITGALVAHRFALVGIHTILLEADEIGYGSTAATTALIQYEIDLHLVDLIGLIGADRAGRSYRLCLEAVGGIEELATDGDDDCGWRSTRSLYLASRRHDRKILEREQLARRSVGIEVNYLTEQDIRRHFPFKRPAALLSPIAGEVDAYRLTHKLLARGRAEGLEVYDRTPVVKYTSGQNSVEVVTAAGQRVSARRAVFATGYETPEFLDQSVTRLLSTYAIATEPLAAGAGWDDERCLVWETARPYFYARMSADGRIIAGGADTPFASSHKRGKLLERRTRKLEKQLRDLLPDGVYSVDWRWAGTFGETKDGLPYIGTARQFPNGYFALGYGGNGITFSWIAGEILLDLFLGRRNDNAGLFGFDR